MARTWPRSRFTGYDLSPEAVAIARSQADELGLDPIEIRRRVAYMPSEYSLYPKLTGAENLTYLANLRGGMDEAFVAQLAERLEVDLTRKVGDLSTGNKQKVGLIQAFMNKSELVILDEPSTGLDPLMQQELQKIIIGQNDVIEQLFAAIFTRGHCLLEGQQGGLGTVLTGQGRRESPR